ncbi:hypothetical protein I4902_04180 [Proteus alimentorum]|uniref:Uncharacterized protein n=1 Tax=Proteus alimentorum TaxID=1973495 RepID=A0ABS0IR38_9GAMM|nr:hypothetical protein [Proteus alimentorum]MBG2876680.1 hypothetical protein [Proteus alimentorum]MBG2878468.1 hypothetical protein [Proteus alimentorum]
MNEVDQCGDIQCHSCHGSFKEFSFVKKSIISITTALVIGTGGGVFYNKVKTNEYLDPRYPVGIEYSIIDTCVSGSEIGMSYHKRLEKRKICICALEKSQPDLPYSEYRKDRSQINVLMNKNIYGCL